MALNGVRAVGDDQDWKTEVERIIRELQSANSTLRSQVANLNRSA